MSKRGGKGGGQPQFKKNSLQFYANKGIFMNCRAKKRNEESKNAGCGGGGHGIPRWV